MSKEIIFIINSLQGGGAERVMSTLATNFHNRKHLVNIICLNYAKSEYKIPTDLKIYYLANRNKSSIIYRIYDALSIFLKLTYLLLSKRPKCVVSFMTTANLWTGLTCLLTSTTYIVSERTTPDHTLNLHKGFLKWFSTYIYKKSKAIVLPSKGIESCLKLNPSFSNIKHYKIIKNPVNQFKVQSVEKVNDKKFILGVGRLSYEKGFDQLIHAFFKLQVKETDLLIVGDGPEKEVLLQLIYSLNIQNKVKLIGHKKNIQDYYSQAELFVLPSRNEGYPNALIEAMSMGCVCIAMNCEFGPSEIIKHHINGFLVEDKNIKKLTKVMSKVLENPVLKDKISAKAKHINSTNSLENITSQWEKLIFST